MARPQADDYAEKQQLIRDRAAELFAARGFAGASIADVAAACGCAKSLIYHYFDSKEEILSDLLEAHVRALIAGAEAALATGSQRGRTLPRARTRAYGRSTPARAPSTSCSSTNSTACRPRARRRSWRLSAG